MPKNKGIFEDGKGVEEDEQLTIGHKNRLRLFR